MPAACPASPTDPFLTGTINFLDCSARTVGAYGYAGLGTPAGPVTTLLTAGLTLAIALFAIRLMAGDRPSIRAPLGLLIRMGVALTLAFSWPAVRTLFFDVTFDAPAQLAQAMTGVGGGPSEGIAFLPQLQAMDDSIQAFTAWGTGREELNAVRTASGRPAAQAFSSVAVSDHLALGTARTAFLTSSILLTGGLRLAGGLLFALLPLLAVFLLFRPTEGLVFGWMRAMLAVTLSSAAGAVLLGLETGLALPWLTQRIAERSQSLATPSTPTELLVVAIMTTLLALTTLGLIARICFSHFPGTIVRRDVDIQAGMGTGANLISTRQDSHTSLSIQAPSRELALAGAVSRLGGRSVQPGTPSSSRSVNASTRPEESYSVKTLRVPVSSRHHLRQSRAARLRSGI